MRARRLFACLACAALALALLATRTPARTEETPGAPEAAEAVDVDLQLVLAVDISGSIDALEARLQRDGYIQALLDPYVVQAIQQGRHGRIALAYTEWAGPLNQRLVVDWRAIDGPESAAAFAALLREAPLGAGHRTSISNAILHAVALFRQGGFRAARKAIDISGDGPNNGGFYVDDTRHRAAERGITINGLPILNGRPSPLGVPALEDIDLYYEDCVIVGPGAFIVVAETPESFAAAVRRKLILEISGLRPPPRRGAGREGVVPAQAYRGLTDCAIGEKRYQLLLRRNAGN